MRPLRPEGKGWNSSHLLISQLHPDIMGLKRAVVIAKEKMRGEIGLIKGLKTSHVNKRPNIISRSPGLAPA
jgi:hypothetical protein